MQLARLEFIRAIDNAELQRELLQNVELKKLPDVLEEALRLEGIEEVVQAKKATVHALESEPDTEPDAAATAVKPRGEPMGAYGNQQLSRMMAEQTRQMQLMTEAIRNQTEAMTSLFRTPGGRGGRGFGNRRADGRSRQGRGNPVICWGCGQPGHIRRECRQQGAAGTWRPGNF